MQRVIVLSLFSMLLLGATDVSAQKFYEDEKVAGGVVKRVTGAEAGLPAKALPGARFMSLKGFLAKYKDRSKTPSGLYILDADFIPSRLPAVLKEEGLALQQDGTLLNAKKEKTTLVLSPRVYRVGLKKAQAPSLRWTFRLIDRAEAANPYPLSWVSWWWSWRTPSGFCRTVRARTNAASWGPLQGGDRPHTRIQYIETRAYVGSSGDRDSCRNCDEEGSSDSWRVGCLWPAYGASGYHYVNFAEGSFNYSWTFRW